MKCGQYLEGSVSGVVVLQEVRKVTIAIRADSAFYHDSPEAVTPNFGRYGSTIVDISVRRQRGIQCL